MIFYYCSSAEEGIYWFERGKLQNLWKTRSGPIHLYECGDTSVGFKEYMEYKKQNALRDGNLLREATKEEVERFKKEYIFSLL